MVAEDPLSRFLRRWFLYGKEYKIEKGNIFTKRMQKRKEVRTEGVWCEAVVSEKMKEFSANASCD